MPFAAALDVSHLPDDANDWALVDVETFDYDGASDAGAAGIVWPEALIGGEAEARRV